ncbi:MAG: SEC-C metal-binding domain-containing protein [Thermodesulfobacteriota bacterium]
MKILERLFNSRKATSKKAELGRNDICWCGSGKKYKRCHLEKDAYQKRMRDDLGRTKK